MKNDWTNHIDSNIRNCVRSIYMESETRAVKALRRIAEQPSCGCVPCTGQCRSQEALAIELDAIRDIAREALNEL